MSARAGLLGAGVAALCALAASPAAAEFPYSRAGSDTTDPKELYLGAGEAPTDLSGKEEWMYAATAEPPSLQNAAVLASPAELNGVRGAHIVDEDAGVETAWQTTTGRPDVVIAVLDSGIKWDDQGAMRNLRLKTWINPGEAPAPRNDGLATPNEPGADCSPAGPFDGTGHDLNSDGAFNVLDYACDERVSPDPERGVGPPGMLDPQDVLIAFSNGDDADSNGYVDDMVGWDFLDDDNDPYDDVQYGHGTGEANDSVAEAENGQDGVGTCPNCMAMHMRVGDSFIADVNRFAAATTYAVDNGALVVQEALGTVNNSTFARDAVEYAYRNGVTVIASAADEAAQHNNWPSSLPHVVLVNSVTKYDEDLAEQPPSYLKFNGCTNFNSKVTLAIPSVSCSSDATGRAAGIAGLVYSAALNALERGKLQPHPSCTLVSGDPCALSANEVRQLMASGSVGGEPVADDVDFSTDPEPACHPVPAPSCTDPFLGRGLEFPPPVLQPVVSPIASTRRYPARSGHDQFYGYGRANVAKSVAALVPAPFGAATPASRVPPEVEITSPDWYDQLDPEAATIPVGGEVHARGAAYTCRVYVAPGHYPNNRTTAETPPGDFAPVPSDHCDGSPRTGAFAGTLAQIDVAALRARFPETAGDFSGREPGTGAQTSAGRPNTAPYGFVVKVVASTSSPVPMTGEDRRAMYLHRDADMLPGFPRELGGDGESSPALADLDGDNRAELVMASADGLVHAWERDPESGEVSELPGWPVQGDSPGIVAAHDGSSGAPGSPAYDGPVPTDFGGAFLGSVAIGDANRDGAPEVYAADWEGQVYGWSAEGDEIFRAQSNPDFSGAPLEPFVNERLGERNRTQRGFLASPVLADLDGNDGGRLELIAAGLDRHVYAWNHDGSPVSGYPVLVVDPSKVESVDPASHQVRFGPQAGPSLQQGPIVNTPAVGDIAGDERPEIVVGTNEEYVPNEGNEGEWAASPLTAPAYGLLEPAGLLGLANGRAYAIEPDGDPDAPASGEDPFAAGWPRPIAIAFAELLPLVGEGINGSPVIAELACSGGGPKVGTMPAAGPAYLLNADGSSCLGEDEGRPRTLSDLSEGGGQIDRPVLPAVGMPAFGDLGGGELSFVAPVAGVIRALDLALNEYQTGGQDFVAAWATSSGQMRPGWPSPVNDLQFLTGPAVGDVGGQPGEEVVAGTASMDLTALSASGAPTSAAWPKLTTDWTVATPLLGSFGTLDTDPEARRVVVNLTRSGYVNAYETEADPCAPASSPRFHHDNANSGDSRRDAVLPGVPFDGALAGDGATIDFRAPGDDLLCGAADTYEVVTSPDPIDEASFASATPLGGAPDPAEPGTEQSYAIPAGAERYVAIRAVDEQGNVGRPLVVDRGGGEPPPPPPAAGACENRVNGTARGERLVGTPDGDRMRGRGGADRVAGRAGDDCLAGGRGPDALRAGPGDDRVRAAGDVRDRVACGPGDDVARVDARDRVAASCERVRRRR